MRKPRIIFFGTPTFAAYILEKLLQCESYDIPAVVCETDKPAGRGQKQHPCETKQYALTQGITVLQPPTLKGIKLNEAGLLLASPAFAEQNLAFVEALNALSPIDAFVTASYGKIIPRSLIDFPRCSMINVHASLLPRWRGAAPIHRALFAGDKTTGVCIMKTLFELDAGPVYLTRELEILPQENFGSLHDRLMALGSEALLEALPGILSGNLSAAPQSLEGVTYAEKWGKSDYNIRWAEPAEVTLRRIRCCAPRPGARAVWGETLIKIFAARLAANQNFPLSPAGTVVESNPGELIVACGKGEYIAILEMQFPGGKVLAIREILTGKKIPSGSVFGELVPTMPLI